MNKREDLGFPVCSIVESTCVFTYLVVASARDERRRKGALEVTGFSLIQVLTGLSGEETFAQRL